MKKLSIIIVNYNTEKLLDQCLKSIGDIPRQWEIIVVDNGSKNRLKTQNFRQKISLIQNKENTGFARANNQGIKKSTGEYVLLLNPDTIVSQIDLKYMVDFMDDNPEVGISTCRVDLLNGEIDDASHRGFPTPWRSFCHFSGISLLFPHSAFLNGYHLGYKDMEKVHEIDACVGAFMMIRRNVGKSLGWLDEDYFWYGEDLDICFRVKQKGWKVTYVPDASITHLKGAASGIKKHSQHISTADSATRRQAQKARFEAMRLFYKKHYHERYPRIVTMGVEWGIRLLEKWHSR